MAAYRRVYDSRHLQADCQEPGDQLRNPTLGNRVCATFTFYRKHAATLPCEIFLTRNGSDPVFEPLCLLV